MNCLRAMPEIKHGPGCWGYHVECQNLLTRSRAVKDIAYLMTLHDYYARRLLVIAAAKLQCTEEKLMDEVEQIDETESRKAKNLEVAGAR